MTGQPGKTPAQSAYRLETRLDFWVKPASFTLWKDGKGILYSYHKNHFFLFIFGTLFVEKSQTSGRRTDRHFFTVSLCVFSLYIYAFESKQGGKEGGNNENVLSHRPRSFPRSSFPSLSLLSLSLSSRLFSFILMSS